ncbi:OLC1v1025804C1 [Oldenlandia corymbosa var. corymbosa]|uniref:OLC1v1025804C1 n=1 Tax=Oldenlandia corymbosa var. corymbosa TaxID=529605 RepID=A0AAV1C5Z4_OLDCO|nr:OLC1v1025804C1 [Oldenlandia corymbosa var. corymbosa]
MAISALSVFKGRPFASSFNSPLRRKRTHNFPVRFALKNNFSAATPSIAMSDDNSRRKLPILLFDVMDTIVRDPFYHDVPAFFRMSFKELIESKHPTVWCEFERGLIDESELARKFFKDERYCDMEGLKSCMKRGYSYIEGVEELLHSLKNAGYEMHAFTNYPNWYLMIEDKLKLSTYLSWTFCSCIFGKRKPEADFYLEVIDHLKVHPSSCIFIDDRMRNVEAAIEAGITGILFKNAELLRKDLLIHGIDISEIEDTKTQDVAAEPLE